MKFKDKEKIKFKVKIKRKIFNGTGRPIEIVVELRNRSNVACYVKVSDTPFEEIPSNCFKITKRGKELDYDGIHVKRLQSPADYVLLMPGAAICIRHTLSDIYNLNAMGIYKLIMDPGEIEYHVAGYYGRIASGDSVKLRPVRKLFFVWKRNELFVTLGEQARLMEQHMIKEPKDKNALYADPTIKYEIEHDEEGKRKFEALVREAHHEMLTYLECSAKELNEMEGTDNDEHYKMTFGEYTTDNHEKAKNVVGGVLEAMKTDSGLVYARNTNPKYEHWCGYTYHNSKTVYLCSGYINAELSGEDSRIGILLHEWTHAICSTDDVVYQTKPVYGRRRCRLLARDDNKIDDINKRAVNNADSYEFFLETQFLNWGNEKKIEECNDLDASVKSGPAAVSLEDKVYIFYKNTDGKIRCAIRSGEGTEVADMKFRDTFFESDMHPEAVIFKDMIYVFYIPTGKTQLYYTRLTGDEWEKGREVNGICPIYPPQPVVYRNAIYLIYKKEDDGEYFFTTGNGENDRWTKEEMLNNQTGLAENPKYNPAAATYKGKLYIFYQAEAQERTGKNKIYYRVYDESTDTWKKGDLEKDSDIRVVPNGEMRAAVSGESLYIWVRQPDSGISQIRMNVPPESGNRIYFTDGDAIKKNTFSEIIPNVDSLCSFTLLEPENQLYYFNALEGKICFCRQKSEGWTIPI